MSVLHFLNELAAGFNPEFCWLMTISLLHSLWQGAFLALIAACLVRSRNSLTVKIEAMVVEEFCKFAQWHFGDSSATRVAILIEMNGPDINRVFIDSNRDRIIEDSEQLTRQTNEGKTWLADLDVEVLENGQAIHAARQIGITPKRKLNSIRITTLGYAEGEIELAGKTDESGKAI